MTPDLAPPPAEVTETVPAEAGDVPCAALTAERLVAAPAPGRHPTTPCLGVRADVAGRFSAQVPDDGISRRFDLARGRVEVGLWGLGPAQVRVAFTATRSGGTTGYIGIDGEAFVPTVPLAEARLDDRAHGLSGAVGIVDDAWVMTVEPGWSLRPVAATYAEDRALFPRSDVGGWFGWTSPRDLASITLAATAGEGATLRERNEGKDLSATVVVRPLATANLPVRLSVAAHARYGTRGLSATKNHRYAVAAQAEHAWVAGGFEAVVADGFDGDAQLAPAGGSLWVRTGPELPAFAWLRADLHDANRSTPDDAAWTWRMGAGPRIRIAGGRAPIAASLGYEGTRYAPNALGVAGTGPATVHTVWLQVGVQVEAGVPVAITRGTLDRPGQ
ncbi:MAG: hypothetical protein RLZZ383_1691 [Pseudomonadota bacterium]|jgi:hypothetical protein